MTEYKIIDLKKQFPNLEQQKDFTLTPIFEVVAKCFYNDLISNPSKYRISDIQRIKSTEDGLWKYLGGKHNLIIDGKITSMTIYEANIDAVDDDEYWWMADRVSFEGNEAGVNELIGHINNFVKQQNLDVLVGVAAKELEKGKTHHLSVDMAEFYFGKNAFTQARFSGR